MQSSKTPQGSRLRFRYYVCVDGRLRYRIPNALHQELVRRGIALPQFANSALFVLEVVRSSKTGNMRTAATIYHFDADGLFEIARFSELPSTSINAKTAKIEQVVNLSEVLKHRRARAAATWEPDDILVKAAQADAALFKSRVPVMTTGSI